MVFQTKLENHNLSINQPKNHLLRPYSLKGFHVSTCNSNDNSTLNAINVQPTFNLLDKVVEPYERLVQAEKEKVEYLEKILKGK